MEELTKRRLARFIRVSGMGMGPVPIDFPTNITGTARSSVTDPGTNETSEEKWQCEHCTLLNDMTTNICTSCAKTSTRWKSGSQEPTLNSEDAQQEQCEHCTSYNAVGTKVCPVCCRSQEKYQERLLVSNSAKNSESFLNKAELTADSGIGEMIEEEQDTFENKAELTAASGIGEMIEEEQDKVYLEIKEAIDEYCNWNKQHGLILRFPEQSTHQSASSKTTQHKAAIFSLECNDLLATQGSASSAEAFLYDEYDIDEYDIIPCDDVSDCNTDAMAAVGPSKLSDQIAKGEILINTGLEALFGAGNQTNSISYSVIRCDDFQRLVKNKELPKEIVKLGTCNCNLCQVCVKKFFEVTIREHHVRNWNCPQCKRPSLEDEQLSSAYFELLNPMLQNMLPKETFEIFETKLRDWHLQKDPNFRWCAHCVTGFIWDQPDQIEMTCPPCEEKTCFKCKKKWEDQHRGLTCEQFTQWKIDNDPEIQSKGVQLYLEENGIDCPGCKMRYSLAKGGCMHFTCPQCGFQFCIGCQQAFHKDGTCKLLKLCQEMGLHCHHPRDCFYYLRDNGVPQLQKLLKNHNVAFNTDPPETQADLAHCFVMEQKESGVQKKDEECGHDTSPGMAGLCSNHYKEYLVSLINKSKIDPIEIMDMNDLKILIERDEKQMPPENETEPEAEYRKRVEKFIKEEWKLNR